MSAIAALWSLSVALRQMWRRITGLRNLSPQKTSFGSKLEARSTIPSAGLFAFLANNAGIGALALAGFSRNCVASDPEELANSGGVSPTHGHLV